MLEKIQQELSWEDNGVICTPILYYVGCDIVYTSYYKDDKIIELDHYVVVSLSSI